VFGAKAAIVPQVNGASMREAVFQRKSGMEKSSAAAGLGSGKKSTYPQCKLV